MFQLDPSLIKINSSYCVYITYVKEPSIVSVVDASTVTVFVSEDVFLNFIILPLLLTALYKFIVTAPPEELINIVSSDVNAV